MENSFEDFNKHEPPKWYSLIIILQSSVLAILLFVRLIILCDLPNIITKSFLDFLCSIILIGMFAVGSIIAFAFTMELAYRVDFELKGKIRWVSVFSPIIILPIVVNIMNLVLSIFSGCANSGIWGILDPRFL